MDMISAWPHIEQSRQLGARRFAYVLALFALFAQTALAQPAANQPEFASSPAENNEATTQSATDSTPAANSKPALALAQGQGQLGTRFKQLQRMMLHLAEFSANSDPHRSSVLKQAISESEQQELLLRFQTIAGQLEKEQYALAEKGQAELRADLEKLLQLLLKEDRANRVEAEKKRIEGLIKEVGRIIKDQRGVKARTEGGDDPRKLEEAQQRIGDKAQDLAEQIAQDEAENRAASGDVAEDATPVEDSPEAPRGAQQKEAPGERPSSAPSQAETAPAEGAPPEPSDATEEGQPSTNNSEKGKPNSGSPMPGDPAGKQTEPSEASDESAPPAGEQTDNDNQRVQKRVAAARERMKRAQKKLAEAERKGAAEEQQHALDELEQAKAALEKILRQLREEEVEQTLAHLEERFRRMLKAQIEVFEGTKRLDNIPTADRDRDDEIEAGRLSRIEAQIVIEADKALNLLRDEGSAVAFPEAVGQMRDDMEQIVVRLAQLKTDKITQGLEADVIAALEEMVEALKQAQQELEDKKNQGQPQSGGEPGEQALVDALAELRMIRALQMRVNTRTKLYSGLIDGEQTEEPELLKALESLAERQLRIHQVTRDLHLGKNQ